MKDLRLEKLALSLVEYSIRVKEGEIVRIIAYEFDSKPLVKELIKAIYKVKGIPIVEFIDEEVQRLQLEQATQKRIDTTAKWELDKTNDMDAVIYIKGKNNQFELSNIPPHITLANQLANKEASNIRVNQKKWVLLNYPTNLSANNAKMSLDNYEDFFYKVMLVDYPKMYQDALELKYLMERTDKVRIVGPNTELTFSIKGMPAIVCAGECNLPDGEVFSAPIINSINGHIHYNTITYANNIEFKDVYLEIKDGKIIKATSETNNECINDIFNSDNGARFFGEFAIGLNPLVTKPVGDILFDEKIYGSFHLTPGQAYEECDNGNKSIIHWDLVCIQTEEYGGGQIYFDDVLIRDNGEFVIKELQELNRKR